MTALPRPLRGLAAVEGATADAPGRARGRSRGRFSEDAMREALAPVRAALLREATAQADSLLATARGRAEAAVAGARQRAAGEVAAAREAGRAQAGPLAAAERSRGHREARSLLLAAQREALEELRRQVRANADALRRGPGYPALVRRLAETARRLAGPGAAVAEHPAGGVIARGTGVVVDCSLPRLADAAVERLGPEVARLWAAEGMPGAEAAPGFDPPSERRTGR